MFDHPEGVFEIDVDHILRQELEDREFSCAEQLELSRVFDPGNRSAKDFDSTQSRDIFNRHSLVAPKFCQVLAHNAHGALDE
jgi:hypothetical protein